MFVTDVNPPTSPRLTHIKLDKSGPPQNGHFLKRFSLEQKNDIDRYIDFQNNATQHLSSCREGTHQKPTNQKKRTKRGKIK